MKRITSLVELGGAGGPLHLALGVFDGVHLGHRAVIDAAVAGAKESGGIAVVVTFEPFPIQVLAPEKAPRRILASLEHKERLLEALGVSSGMAHGLGNDLLTSVAFSTGLSSSTISNINSLNANGKSNILGGQLNSVGKPTVNPSQFMNGPLKGLPVGMQGRSIANTTAVSNFPNVHGTQQNVLPNNVGGTMTSTIGSPNLLASQTSGGHPGINAASQQTQLIKVSPSPGQL